MFGLKVKFSLVKDKKQATKWLEKNLNKFALPKGEYLRNTLVITTNQDYKKFNPRKKFRGENPKYTAYNINI